jgi:hypothetical protein
VSRKPDLSVVLVTDTYQTIKPVLLKLQAQTARAAMEVVLVAPRGSGLGDAAEVFDGFAALRVVDVDSISPASRARAAGVRAATAPVVFLGETHSFPDAGFAAALIDAHRGSWAAIVPGLGNANPGSAWSWAAFLSDYGQWFAGLPAGRVSTGPTWNSSYKREVLMELDALLDHALSGGDELPQALRARDRQVGFLPAARLDHLNVARPGPWMDERFLAGRVIGANRGSRWPLTKRLVYLLASPVILVVVTSRAWRPYRVVRRVHRLPGGTLAAVMFGVLIRTAGEAVGYAAGLSPSAEARMERYELHKIRYTAGA